MLDGQKKTQWYFESVAPWTEKSLIRGAARDEKEREMQNGSS